MRTRLIHTKFWKDEYITELNSEEKLLFVYFLTNEHITILHLYYCPDRVIIFDTGIDRGIITKAKQKFEKDKKIFFKNGWIFLRNAHRYETYKGEKNDSCKTKILKSAGKEIEEWFDTLINTPIHGVYNQDKDQNNNQNKDKEESSEEEIDISNAPF